MKQHCETICNAIAELGPESLRDNETAQEHVAECAECYAFLEAAAELQRDLGALEPIDAPDELVARVLARVNADADVERRGPGGWRGVARSRLALLQELVAAATLRQAAVVGLLLVVVTSGILVIALPDRARMPAGSPVDELFSLGYLGQEHGEEGEPRGAVGQAEERARELEGAPVTEVLPGRPPVPAPSARRVEIPAPKSSSREEILRSEEEEDLLSRTKEDGETPPGRPSPIPEPAPTFSGGSPRTQLRSYGDEAAGERGTELDLDEVDVAAAKRALAAMETGRLLEEGLFERRTFEDDHAPPPRDGAGQEGSQRDDRPERRQGQRSAAAAEAKHADEKTTVESRESSTERAEHEEVAGLDDPDGFGETIVVTGEVPVPTTPASSYQVVTLDPERRDRRAARRFLAERERTEGLSFQEATGYWANTYVPGDPLLRLLDARLAGRDRSAFEAFSQGAVALHDAAHQAEQPFDPPHDAALGVYLAADRSALEGEGRVLVQVGLEATPRRSGRRGAMNVALVLDLRGAIDVETASAMRALVFAYAAARDVGDRFHLAVAGRPGGLLVDHDEFRHGPLAVALEEMLGEETTGGSGRTAGPLAANTTESQALDLVRATEVALEAVTTTDDPSAPLGSSVVVLVTAQPLEGLARLEEIAHASAVAGVPLSVVGVGEGVVRSELDRLALAGHGTRRLLARPADAEALTAGELSAVSRVVARAVRLRIRLAPGVRLVDVLGSRRLDLESAERVRQAEQSIDRRLARNLGIAADRGEDEEGIQIVIPSFYAGDSHVVLLDLVATGAGPVADVTVRYKDLVFLRNGVGRAQVAVARGEGTRGPLELNVLENLLALRLYEALDEAGLALVGGDAGTARDELDEMRTLLAGLASELRRLEGDRGLRRDLAMVDEYLALIDADLDSEGRVHLAESLRLAGRLKVLPRPLALGGGR
jgi:Ca-activated chloride channel family protein